MKIERLTVYRVYDVGEQVAYDYKMEEYEKAWEHAHRVRGTLSVADYQYVREQQIGDYREG